MTDNKNIIAIIWPDGHIDRCVHTQDELTWFSKNNPLITEALLPHGLVTQKELDEN